MPWSEIKAREEKEETEGAEPAPAPGFDCGCEKASRPPWPVCAGVEVEAKAAGTAGSRSATLSAAPASSLSLRRSCWARVYTCTSASESPSSLLSSPSPGHAAEVGEVRDGRAEVAEAARVAGLAVGPTRVTAPATVALALAPVIAGFVLEALELVIEGCVAGFGVGVGGVTFARVERACSILVLRRPFMSSVILKRGSSASGTNGWAGCAAESELYIDLYYDCYYYDCYHHY